MQGTIYIKNGKINNFELNYNGIRIIDENSPDKYDEFPNAYAYPGFMDSHGHVHWLGMKLTGNDFEFATSAQKCVNISLANSETCSGWILGSNWDNGLWSESNLPDYRILDESFPNNPVCFTRKDYHAVWVNSAALKKANITRDTKAPEGGIIVKDADGEPTGVLIDNATDLIRSIIPDYSKEQKKKIAITAMNHLVSLGFTAVCDMYLTNDWIEIYKELEQAGEMPIKIYGFAVSSPYSMPEPVCGSHFSIVGYKMFADGAMGSRGAALKQDYSDDPGNKGILILDKKYISTSSQKAVKKGLIPAVHAIGDAANFEVISAYKEVSELFPDKFLRLEHAQIVDKKDIELINPNNVIISVQPIHCASETPDPAEKRLGKRADGAYLWNSFLEKGCIICAGSDFPVESGDPIKGIDAFVNRKPLSGGDSWHFEEALSVTEAIKAYTINGRIAAGDNHTKGLLLSGFDADITILDKSLKKSLPQYIASTIVLAVYTLGKRVY